MFDEMYHFLLWILFDILMSLINLYCVLSKSLKKAVCFATIFLFHFVTIHERVFQGHTAVLDVYLLRDQSL